MACCTKISRKTIYKAMFRCILHPDPCSPADVFFFFLSIRSPPLAGTVGRRRGGANRVPRSWPFCKPKKTNRPEKAVVVKNRYPKWVTHDQMGLFGPPAPQSDHMLLLVFCGQVSPRWASFFWSPKPTPKVRKKTHPLGQLLAGVSVHIRK